MREGWGVRGVWESGDTRGMIYELRDREYVMTLYGMILDLS